MSISTLVLFSLVLIFDFVTNLAIIRKTSQILIGRAIVLNHKWNPKAKLLRCNFFSILYAL